MKKAQLPGVLSRLLFRLGILFPGALIIFTQAVSSAHAAPPRFGVWVEVEGENKPFVSRASMDRLGRFLDEGLFSDVYAQVYRGGRSWFPSTHADSSPFEQLRSQGVDPLRELLDRAHRDGRRVHAWLNILRVEKGDVPIVRAVGREGVLRDNAGNSLLSYTTAGVPPGELGRAWRLDTPGIWLDPAVEEVRRYVLATIRDLITAYPDLDGIHLDMMRFPFGINASRSRAVSFELGYSAASVANFYKSRELSHVSALINRNANCHEEDGVKCPETASGLRSYSAVAPPSGEEWNEWRRLQVTLLVFEIKDLLTRMAPRMELSAAVLASTERARNYAFQDWPSWVRGGVLDTAVPMAYTADTTTFARYSREAIALDAPRRPLLGIGAWLLLGEPSIFDSQLRTALSNGANGIVLFSYSNLLSERGSHLVRRARTLVSSQKRSP